jgi:muramoyltetrapeptide carboxypeptidase LdcA involved in peptidoglycan recycling
MVAVLSPSCGLAAAFPHVFERGLAELAQRFALRFKEFPSTRASDETLYLNPRLRADDVNQAFADPDVKAIIASIGGDDSLRILPYLDPKVIARNPKIVLGFSDTTTLLTYSNQLGIVTFNGPSIMAGMSQLSSLPSACTTHLRDMLFEAKACEYAPYAEYYEGYLSWSEPKNVGLLNAGKPAPAWRIAQGKGTFTGRLFGGCLEVLEFLKGSAYFPASDFWQDKILFLETSEDVPTPTAVKYALRNYGLMGVFERVSGVLFGRARGYSPEQNLELEKVVTAVIGVEFGRPDLPVVLDLDFGHTDPQWIMPLGVQAEFDLEKRRFRLLEAAVE